MTNDDGSSKLRHGDRLEDIQRAQQRLEAQHRKDDERRRADEALGQLLVVQPVEIDEEPGPTRAQEMAPYWAAIPEVRPAADECVFPTYQIALDALYAAFPVLTGDEWREQRTRLALGLIGITKHVNIEVFRKTCEEVRSGRVAPPKLGGHPIAPPAPRTAVRRPDPTASNNWATTMAETPKPVVTKPASTNVREIRSLVVTLVGLLLLAIALSVAYTHRGDQMIQKQVTQHSKEIKDLGVRVDRIDNRTAELVTSLISEKSNVVRLADEKETLEATLQSLQGELDEIVRTQVSEQRRKDLDVRLEIEKVSRQLQTLQTELERLRLERALQEK